MFSLNRTDELVFQIHPSIPEQQQEEALVTQDLTLPDQAYGACTVPTTNANNTKRHRKKSLLNTATGDNNNIIDESGKKVMHREIERLRRQEMGKLYGSLRNLIPLEFIKGKRSISDHMHQAVNYINHLQGSIKELDMKRNKLIKNMSVKSHVISPAGRSGSSSNNCFRENYNSIVTVSPCWCGVEILISIGLMMEEGFHLSRVMEILVNEEGLNVISYASTRTNQRLLHTIQSQATDPTCIDMSALQQKLNDVVCGG